MTSAESRLSRRIYLDPAVAFAPKPQPGVEPAAESGGPAGRVGVVSFCVFGWTRSAFARQRDERFGAVARLGPHRTPLVRRTLSKLPAGSVPASGGWTTAPQEVDLALVAVRTLASQEAAARCASF